MSFVRARITEYKFENKEVKEALIIMKDSVTADEDEALQTNLATTVTQFTIILNQLIHRNQRFSQNHLRSLAGILDSSGGGIQSFTSFNDNNLYAHKRLHWEIAPKNYTELFHNCRSEMANVILPPFPAFSVDEHNISVGPLERKAKVL